jgi:hypothetical protein
VPDVKFELFFGRFGTFSQNDKGMGRLTPFLVWHTDDSDFLHRRVAQETAFHLDRRDVLSATDNSQRSIEAFVRRLRSSWRGVNSSR